MKRVILICPGRGSYTRECLGTLAQTPSVAVADQFRASLGRPGPTELDRAANYQSRLHVAGENASILTAACSLADRDQLGAVEVAAVVGNSMGWYTALTVAGALPLPAGLRLIETLGSYQANNVIGGQLVYPQMDEDWRPAAAPALEACLREIPGLYQSIRLGGQAVLGGTEAALAEAQRRLPPQKIGDRDAPFLLPLHSAFHTPLMAATAARAQAELADLPYHAPQFPLVDGRGQIWRPRHSDLRALADYTLGYQVVAPYDFTLSLKVALREYAPDHLVLLGPGGNLGGAIAQVLVAEGWAGIRSRADFQALQKERPFLISMARPEQRALLVS